jgi:hypothetical protein
MGARRAQRNAAEAQRESDQDAQIAQLQTQQAAAATPAQPSYATELEQLAGLKQQGIITEEEFEAKKKQILGI